MRGSGEGVDHVVCEERPTSSPQEPSIMVVKTPCTDLCPSTALHAHAVGLSLILASQPQHHMLYHRVDQHAHSRPCSTPDSASASLEGSVAFPSSVRPRIDETRL